MKENQFKKDYHLVRDLKTPQKFQRNNAKGQRKWSFEAFN